MGQESSKVSEAEIDDIVSKKIAEWRAAAEGVGKTAMCQAHMDRLYHTVSGAVIGHNANEITSRVDENATVLVYEWIQSVIEDSAKEQMIRMFLRKMRTVARAFKDQVAALADKNGTICIYPDYPYWFFVFLSYVINYLLAESKLKLDFQKCTDKEKCITIEIIMHQHRTEGDWSVYKGHEVNIVANLVPYLLSYEDGLTDTIENFKCLNDPEKYRERLRFFKARIESKAEEEEEKEPPKKPSLTEVEDPFQAPIPFEEA